MFELCWLVKRNIKLFLKDKRSMVTTFFSPIITIFLFVLFGYYLFENQVNLPSDTPNLREIKNQFIDGSLLVGLLGITTLTSAISLSIFMVKDAEKKIFNDLITTPIKPSLIRASYLIVNVLLNIFITTLLYFLVLIYMAIRGTVSIISALKGLEIFAIIVLAAMMNSIFFGFVFSYIKNVSIFSALSGALSSISGFFIGAFIPLTVLPVAIQGFATIIPATQTTSLLRYLVFSDISQFNGFASQFNITWASLDMPWYGSLIYALSFASIVGILTITLRYNAKESR
ncbi:ABC transporter permease [Mycoplasma sp. Pen4]|uniref:ABC transporter permease n=1 Tax=Mycoplasma sp. Pen4 TaxID=640330 RepID=UPI0016549C34|nr:ABC transporter permease [Mycoplasma sp. Pen4]QNM93927.1 ABC transporter permease [Mycoplasma sp. Pen4]